MLSLKKGHGFQINALSFLQKFAVFACVFGHAKLQSQSDIIIKGESLKYKPWGACFSPSSLFN